MISARRLHSAGLNREGEVAEPLVADEDEDEHQGFSLWGKKKKPRECLCSGGGSSVQRVRWTHLHIAVYPGKNPSHPGVNSRSVGQGAAFAPTGDAHEVPSVLTLTHQRATAVALRGHAQVRSPLPNHTHTHTTSVHSPDTSLCLRSGVQHKSCSWWRVCCTLRGCYTSCRRWYPPSPPWVCWRRLLR